MLIFCFSMNFTRKQILAITRSKLFGCSKPSSDHNYPSSIAFYGGRNQAKCQKFRRFVINMAYGAVRYNVSVTAPRVSIVVVSPKVLEFEHKHEKQKYIVAIKYKNSTTGRGLLVKLLGLKKMKITL